MQQVKFWLLGKMLDPYDNEVKRVKEIELNQELLLIIGTMSTYGKVRKIEEEEEDDDDEYGGSNDQSSSRGLGAGAGAAASSKLMTKAKKKKQQQQQMHKKKSNRSMVMVVVGLSPPTCARSGENILICRRLGRAWHLIGRGEIMAGTATAVSEYYGRLAS